MHDDMARLTRLSVVFLVAYISVGVEVAGQEAGYDYIVFPESNSPMQLSNQDGLGNQAFVFADHTIPATGTVTSWRFFATVIDADSKVMIFRQTDPNSDSFLVVGSLSGAMTNPGYFEDNDPASYLDVQAGDFLGLYWGAQNPLSFDDADCGDTPQYSLEDASTMETGSTYTIPVSSFCRAYAVQVEIRIEIDECEVAPCQNGGTCLDELNGYSCTCVDPYVGPDCGAGPSQNVALASSGATCSANTQLSSSYDCEESIDGDLTPGSGWVTDGMGVGAWIQIDFFSQQVLTFCRFMQVTDANEQFQEVVLSFSDGSTENVPLEQRMGSSDTDTDHVSWDEHVLPYIITTFVHIEAISVYTTGNNGFIEVEFYTAGDDECASSPCGGPNVCLDGVNAYTCDCSAGYEGDNCETDIDECVGSSCQNGATCVDGVNEYNCTCAGGYDGVLCDGDIDECESSPCSNGGTCEDEVNGYNCTCVDGYSGPTCDADTDECASSPCQNGATCVDGLNEYNCTCASGYLGTTCGEDIDECESSPCLDGETCVDEVDGYACSNGNGLRGYGCPGAIVVSVALLHWIIAKLHIQ